MTASETANGTGEDPKIHELLIGIGDTVTKETLDGLCALVEGMFLEIDHLQAHRECDRRKLAYAVQLLDAMGDSIEAQLGQNDRLLAQNKKLRDQLQYAQEHSREADARVSGLTSVVEQQSTEITELANKVEELTGRNDRLSAQASEA